MPPDSWPSHYERCSCGAVFSSMSMSFDLAIKAAEKWRTTHKHDMPLVESSGGLSFGPFGPSVEEDCDD